MIPRAAVPSEIDDAGKRLIDDREPCLYCLHPISDHDEAGFCEAESCNCQSYMAGGVQ